jgi:RecB family exonuclease
VITPRQTRLFRVADLHAFQGTIRLLADLGDVWRARSLVVIVPSIAAADQLRRTIEHHQLEDRPTSDRASCVPDILTREGWYSAMHSRLLSPPRRLSELEREVLLNAAAKEAAASNTAPFRLRPGLLVNMLALYDDLRRRGASVDTFERLLSRDLERDADSDRGAQRLLDQTRFLAAAFREYEARRDRTGAVDEHTLRSCLLDSTPAQPFRHLIVTVGERSVDPSGLWPADFDLLARLPLVEQIDIVATQPMIAAGLLDRLEKLMPGFAEATPQQEAAGVAVASGRPVLIAGPAGKAFSVNRDREEELAAVAVALKGAGADRLDRRAVVFRRPLPYVYLARDVFADAGIPYQTFDALPLAAEPYAATLDLVFEFVTSNFTRESTVALLGSPHLTFVVDGDAVRRPEIAALNRGLSEAGYFGGAARLRAMAAAGPRAVRAAAAAAEELRVLTDKGPPSAQLDALIAFLDAHDNPCSIDDGWRDRHQRARGAVLSALHDLRRAHESLDDSPVNFIDVAATIRRWIEGRTFAPRRGVAGVQFLDAQAARYGEFDEVFLVGLVEGEWPERPSKSIFYPASLLSQLDWPDSRALMAGERAAFQDLMALARHQVHVSTFQLENDAIVSPSTFLDDLGSRSVQLGSAPVGRHFLRQALTGDPVVRSALSGDAAAWLGLRIARSNRDAAEFHGRAAPYRPASHSVSSLERYLQCPFRFFAERVLALEEDPEDGATRNPKERGIFVHGVFQTFFETWSHLGHRAITPANLALARATFRDVVEPLLARVPEGEAAIERTRLLGSAVDPGLAEAVFQVEADWETPVVQRLLEQPLEGEFEIRTPTESRRVSLRGKADRIDLLEDGSFRVIDYKLSRAPDRKHALQLPIYTVCAIQHLRATTGKEWEPGQAGYIAFAEDRRFVPMLARGKDQNEVLLDAQQRLLEAVDRIERGEFPPAPADTMMCERCAHAAVCRKDYVGDI